MSRRGGRQPEPQNSHLSGAEVACFPTLFCFVHFHDTIGETAWIHAGDFGARQNLATSQQNSSKKPLIIHSILQLLSHFINSEAVYVSG